MNVDEFNFNEYILYRSLTPYNLFQGTFENELQSEYTFISRQIDVLKYFVQSNINQKAMLPFLTVNMHVFFVHICD